MVGLAAVVRVERSVFADNHCRRTVFDDGRFDRFAVADFQELVGNNAGARFEPGEDDAHIVVLERAEFDRGIFRVIFRVDGKNVLDVLVGHNRFFRNDRRFVRKARREENAEADARQKVARSVGVRFIFGDGTEFERSGRFVEARFVKVDFRFAVERFVADREFNGEIAFGFKARQDVEAERLERAFVDVEEDVKRVDRDDARQESGAAFDEVPDGDLFATDDAVDRRFNRRVVEVDLRAVEVRLRRLKFRLRGGKFRLRGGEPGLRTVVGGLGEFERLLRRRVVGVQFFLTIPVEEGLVADGGLRGDFGFATFHVGRASFDVRLALSDDRRVNTVVEFEKNVARFDVGARFEANFFEIAGNLGAHVDRLDRRGASVQLFVIDDDARRRLDDGDF